MSESSAYSPTMPMEFYFTKHKRKTVPVLNYHATEVHGGSGDVALDINQSLDGRDQLHAPAALTPAKYASLPME